MRWLRRFADARLRSRLVALEQQSALRADQVGLLTAQLKRARAAHIAARAQLRREADFERRRADELVRKLREARSER